MLIGSQTFPHITISFLSKLLFKVTAPSAFSINIFDILDIYVYFRLMFVFSVIKFYLVSTAVVEVLVEEFKSA